MQAQVFKDIPLDQFTSLVEGYKERGWRFANLCGSTVGDKVELLCSFALGEEFENLSVIVGKEDTVFAVSPFFPSAFLNENETHDLYGIAFKGMTLDYGGRFFVTSVPTPMNPGSRQAGEFLAADSGEGPVAAGNAEGFHVSGDAEEAACG